MKLDQLFVRRFLTAADCKDERRLVIKSVEVAQVNGAGETKPVLRFRGLEQGLVLNKTNAATLAAAFGEESDDCIGKSVILFRTKTDFQGEEVDCVRLRIPDETEEHVSQTDSQTTSEAPF